MILLAMCYIVYHYLTDPSESYLIAAIAVMLCFTFSILCTMLIPVDIYIISRGAIQSSEMKIQVSQDSVRLAYLLNFSVLLFLVFGLVPYAYFYGESKTEVGESVESCGQTCSALRSTAFFMSFLLILVIISLNFQPGRTESFDKDHALQWVSELIDAEHGGLGAMSFSIACLTCLGVLGWVFYSAYGIAAMPFDWLRGKNSTKEQRRGLEDSLAQIRDKCRLIQAKYAGHEDSIDLTRMKAVDRKELTKLQRASRLLTQQNYRLQELEQRAGSIIPSLLLCLVPFRVLIGVAMLCCSFLVVTSLLLTSLDKLMHSPCGWQCGYALKERLIFNPADEIFMRLSRVFPCDFLLLGCLVVYIFAASVSGIVSLGIRVACFNVYALKPHKSLPQALLVLCVIMAHILLALCMALLTIAPNYTSFGSQMVAGAGGLNEWCSLKAGKECQISVISTFFSRISISMPFFSVAYFCANWAFIGVFCMVFVHQLFFQKKTEYVDNEDDLLEEEQSLLNFA